jgi:hypothetical protein
MADIKVVIVYISVCDDCDVLILLFSLLRFHRLTFLEICWCLPQREDS